MATSKTKVLLYLSPELNAMVRADAARRGQSVTAWFGRAANAYLIAGLRERAVALHSPMLALKAAELEHGPLSRAERTAVKWMAAVKKGRAKR